MRTTPRRPRPVFDHSSGLDIIGHRGFGKSAASNPGENTPNAMQSAASAGADWVEIDARRTATQHLAVFHDSTISPTRLISECTDTEIAQSDIYLLTDITDSLPEELGLNIEIKSSLADAGLPPRERTTGLVLEFLRQFPIPNRLLLTSFDAMAAQQVKNEEPDIPCGLITWMRYPLEISLNTAAHLGADVVAVHISSLLLEKRQTAPRDFTQEAINRCHDMGLQIMAWGVKAPQIPVLQDLQVDAVCVDDVVAAIDYRSSQN